ncbi:MAG TPA: precorrin-8X methylmutase [Thiolinea sp.]|nr:precorrin-8X methylmutase [Thiolinea sp.]
MQYIRDPEKIEVQIWDRIRELSNLEGLTPDQQQIVLYLIRSCGEPSLAERVKFSPHAIEAGKKSIKKYAYMLYDHDTMRGTLDTSLLYQEPLCFMNKSSVISLAKSKKQTRAMTAVELWRPYLKNSITVFGYSSTALCRLLELLKAGEVEKPALIIAMPSGFVNTEYAKELLQESYDELGVEYILIEGRWGGIMFAAAAVNALLSIQQGIYR